MNNQGSIWVFRKQSEINNLLFMSDFMLYSRKKKGLDSLVQTICVFSEGLGMESGIEGVLC